MTSLHDFKMRPLCHYSLTSVQRSCCPIGKNLSLTPDSSQTMSLIEIYYISKYEQRQKSFPYKKGDISRHREMQKIVVILQQKCVISRLFRGLNLLFCEEKKKYFVISRYLLARRPSLPRRDLPTSLVCFFEGD